MAQLWGGRFTKETDQLVYNFNASISFDKKFYEQDIRGSIAHVTMLAKQGILTAEEKEQIIDGLEEIRADVENGVLEITDEYEDIHSFVEANLIDRIGEPGKKLHTGTVSYTHLDVYKRQAEGSYQLTRYLLENGHRELWYFVTSDKKLPVAQERISGYRKAYEERGLDVEQDWIVGCDDISVEYGYVKTKQLLQSLSLIHI